jgi:hypothetical protein
MLEEFTLEEGTYSISKTKWVNNPYVADEGFPYKQTETTFGVQIINIYKDKELVDLKEDFQYVFDVKGKDTTDLVCIYQAGENWNQCARSVKSTQKMICDCPENTPVTLVNDHLNIYNTKAVEQVTAEGELEESLNSSQEISAVNSESEVIDAPEVKMNFGAIMPLIVMTIALIASTVVGIYLDTVKEANKIIPTDSM